MVMLTWRKLHLSRVAMLSTFAFASFTSSLSQRRPRAIDAIKPGLRSYQRACCGGTEVGRSISRRRITVFCAMGHEGGSRLALGAALISRFGQVG
jgi:hypothetical protein